MTKAEDPLWLKIFKEFIKYVRINSKEVPAVDERGAPMTLWRGQRMALDTVVKGLKKNVHVFLFGKGRQQGISTVFELLILCWIAVHPGTMAAYVCDKEENRSTIRAKIAHYMKSFPTGFFGKKFEIVNSNKDFVLFSNGSRLDFIVAGIKKNWGESRGYAVALLTEVSKYGKAEGLSSFRETLSENNPNSLVIYESPLALDTPIATPSGWITMRDAKEGDKVFDEKGNVCDVVGTSPVFIGKKCYRLEFSNGDNIIADENHKWKVWEPKYIPTTTGWNEKVVATKDLDIKWHRIEIGKPLNISDIELPIDPYVLGAWLGDGTSCTASMVAGDEDIEEMKSLLYSTGCDVGKTRKPNYRVASFTLHGERNKFFKMGLLNNKHIPQIYLRSSENQRRELLAGLMDTDGYINVSNFQCDFTSTNSILLDNVSELLSSLGIKYRKSKHDMSDKVRAFPNERSYKCSPSWRLNFSESPGLKIFKLNRKKRIQDVTRSQVWRKTKCIKIVSITEISSVPVKCIAVDSESHLFLAGKTMIPTHNTSNGMNHWKDMYDEFQRDKFGKRCSFIGWWGKELNVIKRDDPRWRVYGIAEPDPLEQELIAEVEKESNVSISMEQLAWYRYKSSDTSVSVQAMHQNLPWTAKQSFVATGYSFFSMTMLQEEAERCSELPYIGYKYIIGNEFWNVVCEQIYGNDRKEEIVLRVWEEPNENGYYAIGVDPAHGRDELNDRHAVSVWRLFGDKMVQVAEWADNETGTKQCAWVLAHLAGAYKNCVINVEAAPGPGGIVMNELENLREKVRLDPRFDNAAEKNPNWDNFLFNARWYLYKKYDHFSGGSVKGWESNYKTKLQLMESIRDNFTGGRIIVRSVPLIAEMMSVVRIGDKIGAPESEHDDRVFGMALANRGWVDDYMMNLFAQGELYEHYVREINGEPVDKSVKMINTMIRDFMQRAEEQAQNPMIDPHEQWLYDKGFK